jgi:hypothetical protein
MALHEKDKVRESLADEIEKMGTFDIIYNGRGGFKST